MAGGCDFDENNRADHVNNDICDNAVDGFSGLSNEPANEEIKDNREDSQRNAQKLSCCSVKSECFVDEQRVESIETPVDHGLEENHDNKEPSEWVSEDFSELIRFPVFGLDALIVLANSLNKFDLLFLRSPASFGWRVREEHQENNYNRELAHRKWIMPCPDLLLELRERIPTRTWSHCQP